MFDFIYAVYVCWIFDPHTLVFIQPDIKSIWSINVEWHNGCVCVSTNETLNRFKWYRLDSEILGERLMEIRTSHKMIHTHTHTHTRTHAHTRSLAFALERFWLSEGWRNHDALFTWIVYFCRMCFDLISPKRGRCHCYYRCFNTG